MLEFSRVCAGYGKRDILQDISFTARPGTVTAVVGKNGSGKSTLAACAAGLLPVRGGRISFNGKDLSAFSRKELARTVSLMPQSLPAPGITVGELVSFGRAPYTGLSGRLSPQDKEAVQRAAERCGVELFLSRRVDTLSGGERQRVYLALALAQETPVMFFDEPSSSLDVGARSDFMGMLSGLAKDLGRTVVVITHELSDALMVADDLVVLEKGRLLYAGPTREEAPTRTLERAFGVTRRVFEEDGQTFTVFRAK